MTPHVLSRHPHAPCHLHKAPCRDMNINTDAPFEEGRRQLSGEWPAAHTLHRPAAVVVRAAQRLATTMSSSGLLHAATRLQQSASTQGPGHICRPAGGAAQAVHAFCMWQPAAVSITLLPWRADRSKPAAGCQATVGAATSPSVSHSSTSCCQQSGTSLRQAYAVRYLHMDGPGARRSFCQDMRMCPSHRVLPCISSCQGISATCVRGRHAASCSWQ
jgi:hypothetical protein